MQDEYHKPNQDRHIPDPVAMTKTEQTKSYRYLSRLHWSILYFMSFCLQACLS